MRRHNELTQHGLQVLHFTPGQIRHEPRSVITTIAGALQGGASPAAAQARG